MADTIEEILGEPLEGRGEGPAPEGTAPSIDSILGAIPVAPEPQSQNPIIQFAQSEEPQSETEEQFSSRLDELAKQGFEFFQLSNPLLAPGKLLQDATGFGPKDIIRGADLTFSPVSATAQAIKAKIHNVDPGRAFKNRILQAADLDEIIEIESRGTIKASQTIEDQVKEKILAGEMAPEDAYSDTQIGLSAMVDVLEAFVPAGAAKKAASGKQALQKGGDPALEFRKAVQTREKRKLVREAKRLAAKGDQSLAKSVAKTVEPKANLSIFNRFGTSGEAVLKKLGLEGRLLAGIMRNVQEKSKTRAAGWIEDMKSNIGRLNKKERQNLVKVLDGQEAPINDTVLDVARVERARLNKVFSEAEGALGAENLPGRRENFFPHIFDVSDMTRAEFQNRAINKMLQTGQARSREEATAILKQMREEATARRYGNLEKSRIEGLEGWIDDPVDALEIYYVRAANRIEEAKNFGKFENGVFIEDGAAEDLLAAISNKGGDGNEARRIYDIFVGKNVVDEKAKMLADAVTGAQVVSKMTFGQVVNAPQGFVNSTLNSNISIAMKALRQSFTKEGKDFARRTGALLESTIPELADHATAGGRFSKVPAEFLEGIGFAAAEKQNRIVAAISGKLRAEQAYDMLVKGGKKGKKGRRILEELGINADDAIKRGGLAREDLLQAGIRFSNKTQFTTNILDVPEYFKSPWGRIAFQFKSFAFNHAKFMRDVLKNDITDLKNGNFEVLPNMLAKLGVTVGVGEIVTDLRMTMKGQSIDEREEGVLRLIENFSAVGGLGLFTDMAKSLEFGEKGIVNLFFGPSGGDIIRFGSTLIPFAQEVEDAGSQVLDNILREGIRSVPGAKATIDLLGLDE